MTNHPILRHDSTSQTTSNRRHTATKLQSSCNNASNQTANRRESATSLGSVPAESRTRQISGDLPRRTIPTFAAAGKTAALPHQTITATACLTSNHLKSGRGTSAAFLPHQPRFATTEKEECRVRGTKKPMGKKSAAASVCRDARQPQQAFTIFNCGIKL